MVHGQYFPQMASAKATPTKKPALPAARKRANPRAPETAKLPAASEPQSAGERRLPGIQLGEQTARALILQAGARVFAELGVRPASVADILQTAKVARRTFYRFYDSKEDVLVALYRLGTEGLLQACRVVVQEETDPLRQLERCIDAHLGNARGFGRLVFVLGGEAQRGESALYLRRMEVHEELSQLLLRAHAPKNLDPLLMRALLLMLEGVTRATLAAGDEGRNVSDESVQRAKRVMMRIAAAALLGGGPGVPPLPTLA